MEQRENRRASGRKRRSSVLGIIILVVITLVVVCCCGWLVISVMDSMLRQAESLPTSTPEPAELTGVPEPAMTLEAIPTEEPMGAATSLPADEPEPTRGQEATAKPIPTKRPTPEPETITTFRGDIVVPGTGYMDGRDSEAVPPLTVMEINIWDKVPRVSVVCKLAHGTQVSVLEAKWDDDEGRYYFRVKSGSCEGWVSEPFVSPEYHAPEGDEFP
jgi:hypothetical protein